MVKVLGIETSCDETAVAIVDSQKNILSHALNSQVDIHKKYGGVVPEVAARAHVEVLDNLILQALQEAKLQLSEIDAFAATCGPGLIGGVIVGMMAAKTLSSVYKKPFIAVNHLEAHALTVRLTNEVKFPYLLLLVSGGHCQILLAKDIGFYEKIGETIDDALGEAFDKVAQMLGLPYPGGPEIEKIAKLGDENSFKFSKPLIDNFVGKDHLFNFSFSGLKTAVRRQIEKVIDDEFCHFTSSDKIPYKIKCDIAASFQKVATDIIINRLENVLNMALKDSQEKPRSLVIAGGVAANRYIFSKIQNWAEPYKMDVIAPPIKLCTDNAAMIAWTGYEKFKLGLVDDLNFKPRATWPL
ncbi:MAG: tRNA (adenosine(37)-N6)-threonylcarbamoyltransferase complex transferase subunit TsaD [Pelagibacterales bacterium]|nr:tRNA (adenosine(37)-N6)-threonylcarbamoyltransferase complex transferase subunit TsaD [Pelagibacterales bacterium]